MTPLKINSFNHMKDIHTKLLYLLIVGSLFCFNSCENVYDDIFGDYLNKNPDNRLELDSEEKIRKVLVSTYPQSSYFYLTEMASDNTEENASMAHSALNLGQEQSFRWQEVISDEIDTPYDIWRKYYYSIETACAALEALETIEAEGKISDKDNAAGIEAEALLSRAYGHFVLVNLFSKSYDKSTAGSDLGVPYIEEAEKNLLVEHERGTVQNVYEKIEKDLIRALPNVGKIKVSTTGSNKAGLHKYHWNKEAAYAFAARFFLYYKKYDEAIQYATLALGDNPASMLRNWAADGENSSKWEIATNRYIDPEQTANFLLVAAESIWGRVSGPYRIGKKFATQAITYNEFASDKNLPLGGWLRYNYISNSQAGVSLTYKIGEYFEFLDKLAGIGWTHIVQAIFTADDTLLARAEAYALSGNLDAAVKDLDTFIRAFTYYNSNARHTESKESLIAFMRLPGDLEGTTKHDYNPQTVESGKFKKEIHLEGLSDDQKDVLQGILLAKRALNIHEGTRWFDINRYKIEIHRRKIFEGTPVVTDKLEVNDPRRVFQIPQQMVAAGVEPNPR